jgi:hypothetical protein
LLHPYVTDFSHPNATLAPVMSMDNTTDDDTTNFHFFLNISYPPLNFVQNFTSKDYSNIYGFLKQDRITTIESSGSFLMQKLLFYT